MNRRGDALYERGKGKIKTWYLDIVIYGTRHQRRLGRGITRSVAQELAQVQRAAILKGEAGIGAKRKKDLHFGEARKKFEDWATADKKPNTRRTYVACLDELGKTFSGTRLSAITPWTLEAYEKRRGEGKQLVERPVALSEAEWTRRCRVAERGAPIRANRELAVIKISLTAAAIGACTRARIRCPRSSFARSLDSASGSSNLKRRPDSWRRAANRYGPSSW